VHKSLVLTTLASGLLLSAGCSGGLPNGSSGMPAQALSYAGLSSLTPASSSTNSKFRLAISDYGANSVVLFNRSYTKLQTITDGINAPWGDWYDANGNLYVANTGASSPDVTEYNSSRKLIYTYSTGLTSPQAVTTDSSGNVYVADANSDSVFEYPPGSNTPSATCNTGLFNAGIAVDSAGDVFVNTSNDESYATAAILEYPGGLSGCSSKKLSAKLFSIGGGLLLDKKNDLLACDQYLGVVVIPPPYKKVTRTISYFNMQQASNVAINKQNNELYVGSGNDSEIFIYRYPSGQFITAINESYGLRIPVAVAISPIGTAP
jgi:hypothetical protein